jgi:peptidoglycan/xylan/chitin deacetylase (PgdA/CDA1 family)
MEKVHRPSAAVGRASIVLGLCATASLALAGDPVGQTEITRWQGNKRGAASLTFDDGSINQFRVAVPALNELRLPATFFIITGEVAGSRYHGQFIGRPTDVIVRETVTIPTRKENLFERASFIAYAGVPGARDSHSRAGELYEQGRIVEACKTVDEAYVRVRQGGAPAGPGPSPGAPDVLSWDELRRLGEQGHEIASHTVTHPRLSVLDETNLRYELENSRQEILDHVGAKHTFSVECPYGTEDERAVQLALARYPASRNRMPEPFLAELNRASNADPAAPAREYVQWQRGPLTRTPLATMKSWIDTVAAHDNIWLVLVFHGVDGIGWEPKTGAELKEYFQYIRGKDDQLWVATFQDVAKYMRERMHGEVRATRRGEAIAVTLGHTLDKGLYDLPLTLKTRVPAEWSAVNATQGDAAPKRLLVAHDAGGAYVVYQAQPNAEAVVLAPVSTP